MQPPIVEERLFGMENVIAMCQVMAFPIFFNVSTSSVTKRSRVIAVQGRMRA